jgi:hypothetical protein
MNVQHLRILAPDSFLILAAGVGNSLPAPAMVVDSRACQ